MNIQELKPGFSNLQLELLKRYANGISDQQLIEIKWLLGKYFAEKATTDMDQIIKEKGLSESDIVEKSKEHHRSANRS
ncbi:MAG: hypothetical protein ING84_12390 [Cytophagales bacterium]|jgi:hypothetical protein|nr:hypothetical protein [Cytophagales bacterium]MCA6368290.1 hypothetical protein [Cytophagales bacterium]MCA6371106.1 hypothetical protein [Cytophagales bacterium]MCA6377449.1 hypothetical protein [Cytophagales bacterium]MCA6382949.1 hypothetical protein [Cytophagales bacterium]